MFLYLSDQPNGYWAPTQFCTLSDQTWFYSIIIWFLDLRLKSSSSPQNDKQNDTLQTIIVLLSHPSGSTGMVLKKEYFDMYSGGRHLCWHCSRGWAELLPVAGELAGCQGAWLLSSQKTTRERRGGSSHHPAAFEMPLCCLPGLLDTDPETRIQVQCFVWEEVFSGNIRGDLRQRKESSQ